MSDVVRCPDCKGSGRKTDWSAMIIPPLWLAFWFVDKVDPDSPVHYTYDPCDRCAGKGLLVVDTQKLRKA